MGYLLTSLGNLPLDEDISLYIFVLNGAFKGAYFEALEKNFSNLAANIGPKAVIAKGFEEKLWSGEIAEKYLGKQYGELLRLLPALLLTDAHPDRLKPDSMRLVIPLKEAALRFGDLQTFFRMLTEFAIDKNPKFLDHFGKEADYVAEANAIFDLKPNIFGIGINMNAVIDRLRAQKG